MTVTDSADNKDTKDNFDEAISNINRSLDEKIGPINEKFEELDHKIDSIRPKEKSDPEESEYSWKFADDSDNEDEPVTKKDLKNFGKVFGNEILSEAKKASKDTASSVYETKTSKGSRDIEAMEDFPEMNRSDKRYNPDFYKDVDKEIDRRLGMCKTNEERERMKDHPELLYDAAAVVDSRWSRQGRKITRHQAEDFNRELNNKEDNFSVSSNSKGGSMRPNEYQIELGKKFGLSKEKLSQHFEKIKKNR